MRLDSLHLVNFRQHADTRIEFASGLTGIIGPNGSGKSTILEAIAWALYGNSAARGNKDSIRRLSAEDTRAPVRVELVFELAGHRYRVMRTLSAAECFLDDATQPIATTVTGVSEFMQRRLGMTRSEFFHTYFTGQKELDVMSALGPAERARFLSRVLGYDRISGAQEFVRDRRRTLAAEINGLRQGMADPEAIWRAVSDAEARLAMAGVRASEAEMQRGIAVAALEALVPQWRDVQARRERLQQLQAERRVTEGELLARVRDVERLARELEAIASAQRTLEPLRAEADGLRGATALLEGMERLAAADLRRQTWMDRVQQAAEEEARLAERAARLEQAPTLEQETVAQLAAMREQLADVERTLDEQRTAWARDRQEAETRLEALRTQYTELHDQQTTLEGLGAESPCPTCGRPLGASYVGVLETVRDQLETVRLDGNYYRQRVAQLTSIPAAVETHEATRRQLQVDVQNADRRLQRIQAAIAESATLTAQRARLEERLAEATRMLAELPSGYEAEQHAALKRDVARLQELETMMARVGAQLEREPELHSEQRRSASTQEQLRTRLQELEQQLATLAASDTEFAALRDGYERAEGSARQAELDALAARGESERARAALDNAEHGRRELASRQEKLETLERDRRLHDELDRAFTDIRTDLNVQLRPELADIASGFLAGLTDGRYKSLEFDEDYRLLVLEDEVRKPVISGGEEDLCNLVLRLAISQMIADRAGQAFSLLILDEVFGSLDENRRANVVELLKHLHDRFEQVIVITHIEQVREGLDRVVQVHFDEARRISVVTGASER
ncbi:MAG TPA: SMC family ATPase [Gemmatimonas sp.]|uniref:SMC family ATPase n=1 Tax=Gemmatimonas sp. TaxID=1962908 RepID=UPI002ED8626D